jgi:hypothetical protein
MCYGNGHELAAKAAALSIGVDGQHAEVASLAARLDVDCTRERAVFRSRVRIIDHEKARVRRVESLADFRLVGARAVEDVRLDQVGAVDDANERIDVVGRGDSGCHAEMIGTD